MEPATQHFWSRTGPVIKALKANAEKWNEKHSESQTAVFRAVMPRAPGGGVPGDFTKTFNDLGFTDVFTSDPPPALKMQGPVFNCNFMYRDTEDGAVKFPVFGNGKYIVQHPLGEPGRDIGDDSKSKISHMMVVSVGKTGPITFNEMLPSDKTEVDDLEERLQFLDTAVGSALGEPVGRVGACHQRGLRTGNIAAVAPRSRTASRGRQFPVRSRRLRCPSVLPHRPRP